MMLTGCADRLILYPTTERLNAEGATRRQIAAPQGVLEIWVARPAAGRSGEPEAFVLEFTGNATRAEEVASFDASLWEPLGVEVWAVNYPGYGGSSGPAVLRAIGPAGLAAYDAVAKEADGRRVYVSGTSLGTAAALYVAANRPVAGVVLRNPPAIRQMILGQYGWWNLWLLAGPLALSVPAELDSVANASKMRAPAVFLMADQDEVVPPYYQQKVLKACAGEKRVIGLTGAGHNTPLDRTDVTRLRIALAWLWESGRQEVSGVP
jgi:uncharacterized protein